LHETFPGAGERGNEDVEVCKAVPMWPLAVMSSEATVEELQDPRKMWKYYLGTPDVVEQMTPKWRACSEAPRSFLLVGHPVARCVVLLGDEGRGKTVLVAGGALMPDAEEWSRCGCDAMGFDPNSAQPWTRNRAMFLTRELLARCGGVLQEVYRPEPRPDGGHILRFLS